MPSEPGDHPVSGHVMDGAGFYNRHSAQQHAAASLGVEMIGRAAQGVAVPDDAPTLVADFGASQGKNSMHPLAVALDAILDRDGPPSAIEVVHTDLPDNDFGALFETVANDADSYARPDVFTFAVGKSFYERLFPDRTLSLGWSATAVLWLSSTPCPLPDHLFSYMATGEERETWRRAAAEDWAAFLGHRAAELRPGGELVVSTLVAGGAYEGWMAALEAGVRDARDAGVISPEECAAMVVPTYLSELDDLVAAVATVADGALVVEEATTATAPDPPFEGYLDHGDARVYAAQEVDLLRAWSEPTLMAAVRTDTATPTNVADALYARIGDRLAAEPTACNWSIGLLRLRRR